MTEADPKAEQAAGPEGGEIEAKLVRLRIQRGMDFIATDVFEYEVPIIEAIHGIDNVETLDHDAGVAYLPNDAEAELARLNRKYDNKREAVVGAVYGSVADLGQQVGMSQRRQSTRGEVKSSNVERKPVPRKTAKR